MSIFTHELFKKSDYKYFNGFLITVYLLSFLFAARIKVFPGNGREKDYAWFIEVFFAFFVLVLEQAGEEISDSKLQEVKTTLLQDIQLFFMLFAYYQRISGLFASPHMSSVEFYQWLFYDDLKQARQKHVINDFIS